MSKLTWRIKYQYSNITTRVLSFSFSAGRKEYLDGYPGEFLNITINNNDNFAAELTLNRQIILSIDELADLNFVFYVREITYSDYPGDTGLSTATIRAVDLIGLAGRAVVRDKVLAQDTTLNQLKELAYPNGPMPWWASVVGYAGPGPNPYSTATGTTYSGSVANYLNLLTETERGLLNLYEYQLQWCGRSYVGTLSPISTTYGPTASSTQLAFQAFNRIQNGTQYINRATIDSYTGTVATQVGRNDASIVSYLENNFSATTVDYSEAQANGNANWMANSFADPNALRFQASILDVGQNSTALLNWLDDSFKTFNPVATLNYQAPGGALTSVDVVREGYTIDVTPDRTNFTVYLSPLVYYQFFTLDSASFGRLGGADYTYNTAIQYNETGIQYDETYSTDSARLGW